MESKQVDMIAIEFGVKPNSYMYPVMSLISYCKSTKN